MSIDWSSVRNLGPREILSALPHRFPFLLLDRVLEVNLGPQQAKVGTIVRAFKNVTCNEIQFMGHFPENPIQPGVLTLETMAQAAAFAAFPFIAMENGGVLPPVQVALAGFDNARFRRPIVPGDRMDITVEVKHTRGPIWTLAGSVDVDGKRAAEADMMAMVSTGEKR
jgi:3-hydroxyacyl-[acyl-carrier-protein] dehydratase